MTEIKYVTAADLTKDRVSKTEEDYELPGIGTIRIRALNRREAQMVAAAGGPGVGVKERLMISLSMVQPKMTVDDVGAWEKACVAGEMQDLGTRISDISGVSGGTDKAVVQSFRDGSEPGV